MLDKYFPSIDMLLGVVKCATEDDKEGAAACLDAALESADIEEAVEALSQEQQALSEEEEEAREQRASVRANDPVFTRLKRMGYEIAMGDHDNDTDDEPGEGEGEGEGDGGTKGGGDGSGEGSADDEQMSSEEVRLLARLQKAREKRIKAQEEGWEGEAETAAERAQRNREGLD